MPFQENTRRTQGDALAFLIFAPAVLLHILDSSTPFPSLPLLFFLL
jgi:hypothetical protein